MTDPEPVWLTRQQAADRLQVSIRTVERMQTGGRLRAYRASPGGPPRYRAQDVDAAMLPDTP